MVLYEIPEDFFIVPTEAAWLLGKPVRELIELQESGRLNKVIMTPGQHRRYNMREILALRSELRTEQAVVR